MPESDEHYGQSSSKQVSDLLQGNHQVLRYILGPTTAARSHPLYQTCLLPVAFFLCTTRQGIKKVTAAGTVLPRLACRRTLARLFSARAGSNVPRRTQHTQLSPRSLLT